MDIFGSPHSNNYQEYDFDEDKFEDEDEKLNYERHEDSDEDTEDASETDTGRSDGHLEIKEQMYQAKLNGLKKKLAQLKDGTHYDYNKKVKKLEHQYHERLRLNEIYKEYMLDLIKRDYQQEIKAAGRDFDEKKIDLRENLITDLEEKKRTIETERSSMELTGDSMEIKPAMTRKLRRRPNDPIPMPEKRRKVPNSSIVYLLDEKEIDNDLRLLKDKNSTPIRRISESSMSSPSHTMQGYSLQTFTEHSSYVDAKIEDGKLLYEKRWFHRGQSIYVEGKDTPKTSAIISAIGNDCIFVKKPSGEKLRFFLTSLVKGKVSIKRRAS